MSFATPMPPFPYASINQTGSGNIVIVTNSGNFIRMYGLIITVSGATVITIQDSGATPVLGLYNLTNSGSSISFPLQFDPSHSYFSTGQGLNLVLNSSNSVTIQGTVWYYNI